MYLELSHSILLTTYRSRNFPIPSPFTSRLRFDIANSIHHSSFSRPGESTNISPLMNNHGQLTRPVFHFQALVYRDGNLVSGSLEALVQHMVPTEEYYPDRAYLFAFLLSARLFIKPHELLGEVCALCEHQQNLNGEGGKVRPHESSPTTLLVLLHKSPQREPSGRALYGHRVHYRFIVSRQARPPFRIHPHGESAWHALALVVIMSTRIQARNVSLPNEFPSPRFFLSRFVVSLSGNILSDFIYVCMCVYIFFFSFNFCWEGWKYLIIGIRNAFLFSCSLEFLSLFSYAVNTFVAAILIYSNNVTLSIYYVFEILIYFLK